jgi:hypothetical protein
MAEESFESSKLLLFFLLLVYTPALRPTQAYSMCKRIVFPGGKAATA